MTGTASGQLPLKQYDEHYYYSLKRDINVNYHSGFLSFFFIYFGSSVPRAQTYGSEMTGRQVECSRSHLLSMGCAAWIGWVRPLSGFIVSIAGWKVVSPNSYLQVNREKRTRNVLSRGCRPVSMSLDFDRLFLTNSVRSCGQSDTHTFTFSSFFFYTMQIFFLIFDAQLYIFPVPFHYEKKILFTYKKIM